MKTATKTDLTAFEASKTETHKANTAAMVAEMNIACLRMMARTWLTRGSK